jgi:hypothetical protein
MVAAKMREQYPIKELKSKRHAKQKMMFESKTWSSHNLRNINSDDHLSATQSERPSSVDPAKRQNALKEWNERKRLEKNLRNMLISQAL